MAKIRRSRSKARIKHRNQQPKTKTSQPPLVRASRTATGPRSRSLAAFLLAHCGVPSSPFGRGGRARQRAAPAPPVAMAARRECGGRHGNAARVAPPSSGGARGRDGGGEGAIMKRRKSNFAHSGGVLFFRGVGGQGSFGSCGNGKSRERERRRIMDGAVSRGNDGGCGLVVMYLCAEVLNIDTSATTV